MDWQIELLATIQQIKNPFFDGFFTLVTMSAEETFFIVLAAWFMWCQNKQLAHSVGLAFLTSTVFNPTLKSLFAVERPIGVAGVESMRVHTAEGYAFPSGHTQGATSFWFAFWLYLKTPWVAVVSFSMIALVAFSRLYLGVHWFTDVIGGVVFGIIWVFFVSTLFQYLQSKGKEVWLWCIVLPFFVPFFVYPDNAPLAVSLGASVGFLAGYFVDKHALRYGVKGVWWQQALKLVLGLAVLIALKEGLKWVLVLDEHYADLLRYMVIGFWLTAGAPWLFQRVGLGQQEASVAAH